MSSEKIKDADYHKVHRLICDHYRSKLPENYYLAPFSIKKGSNIYGVVFGSAHLLGLEKFLKVCWTLDSKTGEANYNIDGDMEWTGQLALLPEDRSFGTVNQFEKDLTAFIQNETPDNHQLYEFCLVQGFTPSKTNEVLCKIIESGIVDVIKYGTQNTARKNAFYLSWENYNKAPKVVFKTRNLK